MDFTTQLEIRIGDINYGNHLGNDSFIKYFHEARVRFFVSMGLSEGDIGNGHGIIITEIFCKLKSEAFYGDVLNITIKPSEVKKASFKLHYQMVNQNGKLIATGYTVQATFNYQERKLISIPQHLKDELEKFC